MPIRVIEPDHPLPPGVLPNGVDIVHRKAAEPVHKSVEVLLFKIDLGIPAAEGDRIRAEKPTPALQCLEGQAARQGLVGAEVHHHPQAQDPSVKVH